ncbi:hypothetical protein GCM10010255_29660 [Streptomyces coeruleofuscus]|uniref:Uncharacterized protein n=1 Tax=Streptomyces coeruleofuscus TaxID=66879 RepID=A0ABN3I7T9_9ACTN
MGQPAVRLRVLGSPAPSAPVSPRVPTSGKSGPGREPGPDSRRPIAGRRRVTTVRCRPSLLAAIADHPLRRTAAGGPAAIGAPPSNRAGGGPRAVSVRSLDWQKLPGYW